MDFTLSGKCRYLRLLAWENADEEILITPEGAAILPLPFSESEEGHREENLHCRYTLQLSEDSARFTLRRTREDLDALLEEAEKYGVTTSVGLWQELA